MSPPSRRARSREIDSPRPVPPYLRCVLPSAWRKASKMTCCWCGGMPMPVSRTANDTPRPAAANTRSDTSPFSVNFKALDSRFLRIWPSRCGSVSIRSGVSGSTDDAEAEPLLFGHGAKGLVERIDHRLEDAPARRDLDLAGFDLGEVQDVVDEREQVVAGGGDGLRELDLLRREVAVLVVGEQARRGSARS